MNFDGKPVLVLPCIDRTPVEDIYQKYQVSISGYSNAINPKLFIRLLTDSFGPVVELNINYEAFETLVVFQTINGAESCIRKKEIIEKNHRIKFAAANKPYKLTGLRIKKGRYFYATPERPLPLIPSPYTFEENLSKNNQIINWLIRQYNDILHIFYLIKKA